MDKYFICVLIVIVCICVHLLLIGLTIYSIKDCLEMIAREMMHRDVDDGK